ncbi:hypothetical protein MTR_3g061400 [Medicago truncatula]|uniref:Uncharacterized protein n=1 Tax=Medicago truncatula TaxID=3880 RepID=G7IY95_MEDTR|nr:hypothetical protein MTR_3g061400 [Medicago truncatula]
MVMASLDVYQTIFFSDTTTTPSRFNLHPNKPPTFSFQKPFNLHPNDSSLNFYGSAKFIPQLCEISI